MRQRRHPIFVGQVHVGAMFDQQCDDALMSRSAIGQDDRLQQRCPSQVVDVIDVDVGVFQQPLYNLDVAALRRRDDGDAAVAIGELRVRVGCPRQLQDVEIALGPAYRNGLFSMASRRFTLAPASSNALTASTWLL